MEIIKQWIEKLQLLAKDPAKLSLVIVGIFFIGILFSAFRLATLSGDLVYLGGMTSSETEDWVLTKLIVTVGITLLLGVASIYSYYKSKKEIFVFVEKQDVKATADETTTEASESQFDLKSFQESLAKLKNNEERRQHGLNQICNFLEAGQGAFYSWNGTEAKFSLGFAFAPELELPTYALGDGLIGQAATGKTVYLDELPEDYVRTIESGLGTARPRVLFVMPIKKDNQVTGIVEVAAFKVLSESVRKKAVEAGNILADNS